MMPRARTPITAWAFVVALLATTLFGCGESVPVYLTTSEPGADASARVTEVMDDAFGVWGRPYHLVDDERGALRVSLVALSPEAQTRGATRRRGKCRIDVWSDLDANTLGHELGHAWGLDHVDNHDNLMSVAVAGLPRGWEVSDAQYDEAQHAIERFIACPGGAR